MNDKSLKRLPKTLFGRLFLLIISLMLVNFILLRLLFVNLVAEPGGHQFAYLGEALGTLIKGIEEHGNAESKRQVAEQLQKRTGMILLWNVDQQWDKPPDLPYYRSLEKTLAEIWGSELVSRFQREPRQIFWLLHSTAPQFSLGVPLFEQISMWKYLSLGIVMVLVFSVTSAYIAAHYLKSSLIALVDGVKLMGQGNIGSHVIEPQGPEEIRAVARAMNTMGTDFDRMIKKQEFLLAGISHDLRTPLTRIRIATRLIGADADGFTEGINADIEEIDGVLAQFIDLARFNIEQAELWQVGDINWLLCDMVKKYQHSEIKLVNYIRHITPVRYKPMALQRYLYNLINNSIKHASGKVTLSTRTKDNNIELCVTDEGPGFPMTSEELKAYSDLDVELGQGNGLGLRIVQQIAKLHEGELTLRNRPEGGAEVILSLKAYWGTG